VVLTAVLYGIALFLPAFRVLFNVAEQFPGWVPLAEVPGWVALTAVPRVWWAGLTGAISERDLPAVAVGVLHTWPRWAWVDIGAAWLANPLLLAAVVCLLAGWRRVALVTSALAFTLGLFAGWLLGRGGAADLDLLLPGYSLWLVSLSLPTIFSQRRAGPAASTVKPA
jgi:hypothetical protein